MAKIKKTWMFCPPKESKSKVPEDVQKELAKKANELIETVLKSKHIKPPPKDNSFNYLTDIYTKWHSNYFYFIGKYNSPSPNAISPFFEMKFARLEYIGNKRFNLSYMRHTEKWWEIYTKISEDECLKAIRDEPHFIP